MHFLTKNFATYRGLIRTILADLMWRIGIYRKYGKLDWKEVKRLVFICQGNICRSPFALYVAERNTPDIPMASFGLATSTGAPAEPLAIDVALSYGIDLQQHKATDLSDFKIKDGDLLIVMEDRHIDRLSSVIAEKRVQICLLGLWCKPRFALLYDPFSHKRPYFESCFDRINRAVKNLLQEYKFQR